MTQRFLAFHSAGSVAAVTAMMLCGATTAQAQRTGVNIELHANKHITAANLGLPDYPAARAYTDSANESPVDLGLTFGDVHFRVLVSKYLTGASPRQVFDFYRTPLARYGEVLECDHGEPVGSVKIARGGLTCSDSVGKHSHTSGNSGSGHELRSGTPHLFRIVALETPRSDSTQFTLVLIELPRDTDSDETSK